MKWYFDSTLLFGAYLLLLWENTFICTPVSWTFIHISSAINYKTSHKNVMMFLLESFFTILLSTILWLKIDNFCACCSDFMTKIIKTPQQRNVIMVMKLHSHNLLLFNWSLGAHFVSQKYCIQNSSQFPPLLVVF